MDYPNDEMNARFFDNTFSTIHDVEGIDQTFQHFINEIFRFHPEILPRTDYYSVNSSNSKPLCTVSPRDQVLSKQTDDDISSPISIAESPLQSFQSSFSSSIRYLGDGSLEEKKSKRESNGSTENRILHQSPDGKREETIIRCDPLGNCTKEIIQDGNLISKQTPSLSDVEMNSKTATLLEKCLQFIESFSR